jgi:hypothetical protein
MDKYDRKNYNTSPQIKTTLKNDWLVRLIKVQNSLKMKESEILREAIKEKIVAIETKVQK